MSTEHLTAEQSLKIYKIRASATGDSVSADEADGFIAGYRAAENEVEQQTKQLKEEREDILQSLFSIRDMVGGSPWAVINKLIDQLKQNNEG